MRIIYFFLLIFSISFSQNKITKSDKSIIIDISIDRKFKKDLIEKASILINGVSLTISKITKKGFKLWIIPHTLKLTNLNNLNKKVEIIFEDRIQKEYKKSKIKYRLEKT